MFTRHGQYWPSFSIKTILCVDVVLMTSFRYWFWFCCLHVPPGQLVSKLSVRSQVTMASVWTWVVGQVLWSKSEEIGSKLSQLLSLELNFFGLKFITVYDISHLSLLLCHHVCYTLRNIIYIDYRALWWCWTFGWCLQLIFSSWSLHRSLCKHVIINIINLSPIM